MGINTDIDDGGGDQETMEVAKLEGVLVDLGC